MAASSPGIGSARGLSGATTPQATSLSPGPRNGRAQVPVGERTAECSAPEFQRPGGRHHPGGKLPCGEKSLRDPGPGGQRARVGGGLFFVPVLPELTLRKPFRAGERAIESAARWFVQGRVCGGAGDHALQPRPGLTGDEQGVQLCERMRGKLGFVPQSNLRT